MNPLMHGKQMGMFRSALFIASIITLKARDSEDVLDHGVIRRLQKGVWDPSRATTDMTADTEKLLK
jgi:hypothetical protein